MNPFDISAHQWDENPIHFERSQAIATALLELLPANSKFHAVEFGAGTGILSLMLKDKLSSCILVDSSSTMLQVAKKKIETLQADHLLCKLVNLEIENWDEEPVDFLFTQMALHHVKDIKNIFATFSSMIHANGYLAIADLYPEDGSFHGEGHDVHLGFDTEELIRLLSENNFSILHCKPVFIIKKDLNSHQKEFPVFLLLAQK